MGSSCPPVACASPLRLAHRASTGVALLTCWFIAGCAGTAPHAAHNSARTTVDASSPGPSAPRAEAEWSASGSTDDTSTASAAPAASALQPALIEERGGTVRATAWDGQTAFVALHSRILALDPLAPSDSALLGSAAPLGWRVADLAARDGIVLAVGPELAVLDATDPEHMRLHSRLPLVQPARTVAWAGEVAWLITIDDRLLRFDLSDLREPRRLPRWQPPVPPDTTGLRFEPVSLASHKDRLVLLARWPDVTPPRRGDPPGWPGGELLLVNGVASPVPRLHDRRPVPCCGGQVLVDGDTLVVVDELASGGAWLGIDSNDRLTVPQLLPEFSPGRVIQPTQAFALHGDMLWFLDRHHRVGRVRLDPAMPIEAHEDLPGSYGPAVLEAAGDRLLYTVPRESGWLMPPSDPPTMKPARMDGPALGARAVRAMAVMTEGAYVALEEPFLAIAPREPAETFIDDLVGLGRYDDPDQLWADGDRLYARDTGRLIQWRRTGPRAMHELGELELRSNGASHIHAVSGDLFAYSSGEDLFVTRLDGEGGDRLLAHAQRPGWQGRTSFRDGLLWLFDQPRGVFPRMMGLHYAGGTIELLSSSIVSPSGSVAPQLARSGALMLVGLGNEIIAIDMRDPRRPTPLGQTDLPGPVVAVALDGTTGWVIWHEPRGARLGLFDLSVPSYPVASGSDVALAAEPVPVDLQLWEGEAWLLVDDVLQRRRAETVPTPTPTRHATTTPRPSATPTTGATATSTTGASEHPGRVWLPWAVGERE